MLLISTGFTTKKQAPKDNISQALFRPPTFFFLRSKGQREAEVSRAGWLQGQGSIMRVYRAQRVANRLDTEIRV